MFVDVSKIESIIAEVGATEIMPRFRKLAQSDIEMKGIDDPVTVADKAAEIALGLQLNAVLPGSVLVGEEAYASDNCILSRFMGDEYVWVVDPIDGTRNFINGKTEFGVILALVHHKQTIAGWIHDPNTGDTLLCEKGSGVWLRGNKMRLAKFGDDFVAHGILGWGAHRALLRIKEDAKGNGGELPNAEYASAASFDYPRLLTGDVIFANSKAPRASFLLGVDSKPWDHLAGLFMVAEAGGYSASLRGKPYEMDCLTHQGLLTATGPSEWEQIKRVFDPVVSAFINP